MIKIDPHHHLRFVQVAKLVLSYLPSSFEPYAKRFYQWSRKMLSQSNVRQIFISRPVNAPSVEFPALNLAHCLPWELAAPPGKLPVLPSVTIVVPIHNAFEHVRRCLDSVIAHTSAPASLLLIDDASTDNRMAGLLDAYQKKGARVCRNSTNLGYTATVNRGIRLAGEDDVVLLNSDTQVSPRWLDNLRLAAYSAHDVGSATPFSDNAGAFSAPDPGTNDIPEEFTPEEFARLVGRAFRGAYPEAPTGNGFCLYLKRAMLEDVGDFDEKRFPRGYGEENDLSLRALDHGWRHVVDTRTYVRHARSASFGNEKNKLVERGRTEVLACYPEYPQLVGEFLRSREMAQARAALDQTLRVAIKEERPRPRILFVISTKTGGTPQTNHDLMVAVAKRYEPFLLVCDSEVVSLFKVRKNDLEEVENVVLSKQVRRMSHRSRGYDQYVYQWLIKYCIELVHIRHLVWHSLDLPRLAASLNIPVVFSFHDFYLLCPSLNLVNSHEEFCNAECNGGVDKYCTPIRWMGELPPPLGKPLVMRWRTRMTAILNQCDAYVTTSESSKNLIQSKIELPLSKPFRVIPHGRNFKEFLLPQTSQLPVKPPYRVLIPGNIGVHKGANLLSRIHELDTEKQLEFHFLGVVTSEAAKIGVQHGPYMRGDFLNKVAGIQPYVGLVFSIWAETYCHTLTELWASGIPVIALDFGAVGERIRRHGGGWLISSCDPKEVLAQMLSILSDHEGYLRRCEDIRSWQSGYGRRNTTRNMAAKYIELYEQVIQNRLAIRAEGEVM
jgi:GT2 family glycosyltransferase/glycosyltransferase involved in cell wall biosynthesis